MKRERSGARVIERSDAGFTLLELMMVVLIIAILIAVLLPTFLGASQRANDRAVQASLRNALTAAKAVYVDGQDYAAATPLRLNSEGVPVKFVAAGTSPSGQNSVSVYGSSNYLVLGAASKSGTCFYLEDDAAGAGTLFARQTSSGGCSALGAPLAGDPAWKSAW
jgi:prepilin-type N-terminal cleavage/methylation domain-containing protein